jgi:hypothetical protein
MKLPTRLENDIKLPTRLEKITKGTDQVPLN